MDGPGFDGPGSGPASFGWGGIGLFAHLAGFVGGIVIFAAVVLLVVLLVRYLLVATRAAKLYIERNPATPPVTPQKPKTPGAS